MVSSGSSGFWFCNWVVSSVRKVWKLPASVESAVPLSVAPEASVLVAGSGVHLLTQHNVLHEQLAAATPDPNELAGLWSTFETLNRVTADELVAQIRDAGFELVRVHKGTEDLGPAAGLKAVFDDL